MRLAEALAVAATDGRVAPEVYREAAHVLARAYWQSVRDANEEAREAQRSAGEAYAEGRRSADPQYQYGEY